MSLKTWRAVPRRRLAAFALAFAAASAAYGAHAAATGPTAAAQTNFMLERRISVVEQRLNTIELSISRLEQQSRISTAAPPSASSVRDTEVELLRSEVELLRRRLAEDECGLVRLDERTLTQAAREARRKSAGGREDPCRLDASAPLRLSSRQ